MSLLFTHPLLLAALAGLGVPVLIHLLLKQKSPRLRFSTVRFFHKQEPQASAKRRLRKLLLLLLRLLVFALLVLAFARPYLPWPSTRSPNARRRQVILVLDRSASLQARDGAGSRWLQAKQVAAEILAGLGESDRAALVICGTPSRVAAGLGSPSVVAQLVAELTPGFGSSELAAGLREATRVAATGESAAETSIAVISDFQKSSSLNLDGVSLPARVEVKLHPTGDRFAPNVAVADLQLERTGAAVPQVTLVNYGDDPLNAAAVELAVDGKSIPVSALRLAPGEATNLPLTLPSLPPGWHAVEARIAGRDALSLDDVRHGALLVPERTRVWLVEGRPGRRSFEEQTFFLSAALDPAFGTTNASVSRFSLEKIRPDELARRIVTPATHQRPEVILLPAQSALDPNLSRPLGEWVRGGGGLLLWVGEETNPNRFNLDFAGLAPVVLRTPESTPEIAGWHLGEVEKTNPFFAPFRRSDENRLALAGFTRRYAVTPGSDVRIEARFADGSPFLVSRPVGRGQVLLANTTADTAWSDWPKRKSFVPWLHQTVLCLAGHEGHGSDGATAPVDDWDLGLAAAHTTFQLTSPNGGSVAVVTDAQGRLKWEPEQPGIYRIRDAAGREVRWVAVNVPAPESELTAVKPGDIQRQLARAEAGGDDLVGGGLFKDSRNQRELWRVVLSCALGLLLVETVFATRSYP